MLFESGKRPDRHAVREFASNLKVVSVSHDPVEANPLQLVATDGQTITRGTIGEEVKAELAWLELLRDGLVFDLRGLAPRESAEFPKIDHLFDFDETPGPARYDAMHLVPGLHLSGGANSLPVVQSLISLTRDLVHHFDDLIAIIWPPAKSVIGRRFFESVSTAWLEGGAFPALGLTAFRETVDGALQSVGLDFWIDQELRIEPPLSADKTAATRLGVRLVNQMILVGGIEKNERLVAPDGNRLALSLSRNRKFIRIAKE